MNTYKITDENGDGEAFVAASLVDALKAAWRLWSYNMPDESDAEPYRMYCDGIGYDVFYDVFYDGGPGLTIHAVSATTTTGATK